MTAFRNPYQFLMDRLDTSLKTDALFGEKKRPGQLLPAEGLRVFQEVHVPAVRAILDLKRPRLIDCYHLGAAFCFVLDQGVHRQMGHGRFDLFFCDHFGIKHSKRALLYRCGDLVRSLERTWIEQAYREVSLKRAYVIGYGNPPLAAWIRNLLFVWAYSTRCSAERMRRIHHGLYAHLRRWPWQRALPSAMDLLDRIEWLSLGTEQRMLPDPSAEEEGAPATAPAAG